MKLAICIISAGRPTSVPKIQNSFKECIWYVPKGQTKDYITTGAKKVIGVDGSLPMKAIQLNQAIEEQLAVNDIVATIDDDIVKCINATTRQVVYLQNVVEVIAGELFKSKYSLGGPYSGTNTSWAPKEIKNYGLIPGAMMLHKKSSLRFDTTLPYLDDLDFCIQHHVKNGGVLLHGVYCLENQWGDNPGGYQDCKTVESRKKTVEMLKEKWPTCHFEFDEEKKNQTRFRVPWKKLAGAGR